MMYASLDPPLGGPRFSQPPSVLRSKPRVPRHSLNFANREYERKGRLQCSEDIELATDD